MIRLRSFVVIVLVINLLQFSNASPSVVNHLPGEETCDLPCVDKIADRISKHVEDRYTALEISIIQKLERQLIRMEQIIVERITIIEAMLTKPIVENVDITHNHVHEESYEEIQQIEHNTTHHEVVKDLVVSAAENDTKSAQESTVSTTPQPAIKNETPNSSDTITPEQPEDCVQTDKEVTDYDEDYAQQFIEARVGSSDKRPCVETSVTKVSSTLPSVVTERSTTAASALSLNGSNYSVTQSSVSEKPVYDKELDIDSMDGIEEPTTVSDTNDLPSYSQIEQVVLEVFPDTSETQEATSESMQSPSFDNVATAKADTATERIVTTTTADASNFPDIVFPDDEVSESNKFGQELFKPIVPPKKIIHPWIRTSTSKPENVTLTNSSISTTTVDPNTYKIHFPTESSEADHISAPKLRPMPKPPQAFKYARNYLNGTWTIIHSRNDGSVSFNRSWVEYRTQFGRLPGEYWMGLEAIHQLTKAGDYELLVVLQSFDGTVKIAAYDSFWVGSEVTNYRLALGPFVGGTAGDSFSAASGQMFSTYDRDNDRSLCASCAELYHSGWWFKDCADANLNGIYVSSRESQEKSYGTSMNWWSFNRDYQGLKEAAMMIRKRARKLA